MQSFFLLHPHYIGLYTISSLVHCHALSLWQQHCNWTQCCYRRYDYKTSWKYVLSIPRCLPSCFFVFLFFCHLIFPCCPSSFFNGLSFDMQKPLYCKSKFQSWRYISSQRYLQLSPCQIFFVKWHARNEHFFCVYNALVAFITCYF